MAKIKEENLILARKIATEKEALKSKKFFRKHGDKVKFKAVAISKGYQKGKIIEIGEEINFEGFLGQKNKVADWLHPISDIEILEYHASVKPEGRKEVPVLNLSKQEDAGSGSDLNVLV